jgi:hypothetical protein
MNKYLLLGLGVALAYLIYKNSNKKSGLNFREDIDKDKVLNNPNTLSELDMKYSESLANDILPFERAMGNEGRNIVNLQKGLDSDPTFDVDNDVFVGSSIKFRKSSGVVPKRAYKMYDSSINDTISRSRIRLKIRK